MIQTPSHEELLKELERLRQSTEVSRRDAVAKALGLDRLLRFVLVPSWTARLVEEVIDLEDLSFESGELTEGRGWAFIRRARNYGFCEIEPSSQRCRIDRHQRQAAFDLIGAEAKFQAADLLPEVGAKVLKGLSDTAVGDPSDPAVAGLVAPRRLKLWADLASSVGEDACGRLKEIEVSAFTESELDPEERDRTEPEEWLRAAESIGELIGGTFVSAAQGLERALTNKCLRRREGRALESYLEREAQHKAVRELLTGPDENWALHVMGGGGLGKTMLVRKVVADLANEHGYRAARIDFDLLSPRYPVEEPGQLLHALMYDLLIRHGTQADIESDMSLVDHLSARTREIEGQLSGDVGQKVDSPLGFLADERFKALVENFVRCVLNVVPDGKVLLVLDTCEELARLRLPTAPLPQVEATLRILESVHEKCESIRVLFAGRRYLAKEGRPIEERGALRSKWSAPPSYENLPKATPYLDLYTVQGFDHPEAVRYLTERRALDLQRDTVEQILQASQVIRDGAAKQGEYNPYELTVYANWLDEAGADAIGEVLAGSPNPYIASRILGRITHPDVLRAVPLFAQLDVFSPSLLREAMQPAPEDPSGMARELLNLEWLEVGDGQLLYVRPELRPKLLQYLEQESPTRLRLARQMLTDSARRSLQATPLRTTARETIAAAVRFAPADEFAKAWDDLSASLRNEEDYDWLRNVVEPMLGADGTALDGHPALAGILAQYTVAREAEGQPRAVLRGDWERLQSMSQGYPTDQSQVLTELATVALETCSVTSPDFTPGAALERFVFASDDLVEAHRLVFLEALLESPVLARDDHAERIANWAERFPLDHPLRAGALTAAMRYCARQGDESRAFSLLDLALVASENDEGHRFFWGWIRPADLWARTRLEALVQHFPSQSPLEILSREWVDRGMHRVPSVDRDRLLSICLSIALDWGLPDLIDAVAQSAARQHLDNSWLRGTCLAHRLVPPLFVTFARYLCQIEGPREAIAWCDRVGWGDQQEIAMDTVAVIVATHRLDEEFSRILVWESKSGHLDPLRFERYRTIMTAEPSPQRGIADGRSTHAWFLSQIDLDTPRSSLRSALRGRSAGEFATEANLRLDLVECGEKLKSPFIISDRLWMATPGKDAREELGRIALRQVALGLFARSELDRIPIGPERLRELAAEEGVILARRLPRCAARLIELAFSPAPESRPMPILGPWAAREGRGFVSAIAACTSGSQALAMLGYTQWEAMRPTVSVGTTPDDFPLSAGEAGRVVISDYPSEFTGQPVGCTIVGLGGRVRFYQSPGCDVLERRNDSWEAGIGSESLRAPLLSMDGLEIEGDVVAMAEPWELAFTADLSAVERLQARCVRVVRGARSMDLPQARGENASFVTEQWAHDFRGATGSFQSHPIEMLRERRDELGYFRTAHLVGRAEQDSRGFRLVFSRRGQQSQSSRKGDPHRDGMRLSAHDLPMGRTHLVVLQGEPVQGLGEKELRSPTTVLEAALQRGFGAELSARGVPFVLVIPSLAPRDSLRLAAHISDWLAEPQEISRRTLLALVDRLREDLRFEYGGDISLFVHPDRDP